MENRLVSPWVKDCGGIGVAVIITIRESMREIFVVME